MEEQNKSRSGSQWDKYPTIEEQKVHFQKFSALPVVLAVVIGALGLLGGIAAAVASEDAVIFFVVFLGALVTAALTFAILRILISSQILTVLYLEKIGKQIEDIKTGTAASEAPPVETDTAVPAEEPTETDPKSDIA